MRNIDEGTRNFIFCKIANWKPAIEWVDFALSPKYVIGEHRHQTSA
jgi:hypothetical protein